MRRVLALAEYFILDIEFMMLILGNLYNEYILFYVISNELIKGFILCSVAIIGLHLAKWIMDLKRFEQVVKRWFEIRIKSNCGLICCIMFLRILYSLALFPPGMGGGRWVANQFIFSLFYG